MKKNRIKIAEAMGWNGISIFKVDGTMVGMLGPTRGYQDVPDYFNDLNAMHEAEKSLSDEEWGKYLSYIMVLARDASIKATAHATASQKAEAFIYAKNL